MIKDSTLGKLTKYFLDTSPEVISEKARLSKLLLKAKKIITKSLNQGIKSEEKDLLLRKYPNALVTITLRMGDIFKRIYYPGNERALLYNPYYVSTAITIGNVPRYCILSRGNPDIPREDLNKIIPLNDEIIGILERIQEISECFRRFVTPDTSLVWLRKNMPGVYQKLKEYEN